MASEAEAIEALVQLGLSEYEARCFVALTQLSEGTAKEISQIAEVPQSRVYDVTEALAERGLVDIQRSEPKRYYALPVTHAMKSLQADYTASLETANDNLQALEGRETDESGVWEIANREDVAIRLEMHIEAASEEVYLLVAHEDLLTNELLETLAEAADGSVDLFLEVPTTAAREQVHDVVPAAHVAVVDFGAHQTQIDHQYAGRLLMADRETVLLSARQEGLVPSDFEESGVWGSAVSHGLVVWIQQLLDARKQRLDFPQA
jgi:sugar-specific transcriptional regulator TrmB